jgi:hypothetical protein
MDQSDPKAVLEIELKRFNQLESKIEKLIDHISALKKERDSALKQRAEIEVVLRRREAEIAQLKDNLNNAEKRAIDPQKTEAIKNKISNLIEKLDEFE